ncbi:MAG TPA: type II secretion system protein N [Burkholderiales bacterium]|nr:type II secretion system protein N [Burkholderiales bacterium]
MKKGLLVALAAGLYLAALLVLLPAGMVDFALQRATDGRLRLADAQGTVWKGSGTIEVRDTANRSALSKGIEWHVRPESLWRARLVCEVVLARDGSRFVVSALPSSVEIYDAVLTLPMAVLTLAEPRLKPLRLSGDLKVQSDKLAIAQNSLRGLVKLQWRDAGSELSPVSPIGGYELRLDGQGDAVQALLTTLQGPLQLDGSGSWRKGGNLNLQATMRVPEPYREQLAPLLRLFSFQRDEGTFELQLK